MAVSNLWQYYSTRGEALPSVEQRRSMYNLGPGYVGTAAQNQALLASLQNPYQSAVVASPGGTVPTVGGVATSAPVSDLFVSGVPDQYMQAISDASSRYGISPKVLSALLKQESGFQPDVVSPAGAVGIAQFMPQTALVFGILLE